MERERKWGKDAGGKAKLRACQFERSCIFRSRIDIRSEMRSEPSEIVPSREHFESGYAEERLKGTELGDGFAPQQSIRRESGPLDLRRASPICRSFDVRSVLAPRLNLFSQRRSQDPLVVF